MTDNEMTQETKKPPACAMCGKPVDPAHKPFCSRRCADLDLHRWLKGSYVIAGEPVDDDDARLPSRERDEEE